METWVTAYFFLSADHADDATAFVTEGYNRYAPHDVPQIGAVLPSHKETGKWWEVVELRWSRNASHVNIGVVIRDTPPTTDPDVHITPTRYAVSVFPPTDGRYRYAQVLIVAKTPGWYAVTTPDLVDAGSAQQLVDANGDWVYPADCTHDEVLARLWHPWESAVDLAKAKAREAAAEFTTVTTGRN